MKSKKIGALVMALCMLMCIAFAMPVGASQDKASVVFEASEPDSEGYFSMTMRISNAQFNAFQFVLRYDPDTVQPVSYATKQATAKFSEFAKAADGDDWMATIGTSIDTQQGLIDFTGYVTPGQSVAVGAEEITGVANVGQDGLEIFTFYFKKTGSANVVLELATAQGQKASQEYLPTGGALSNAGLEIPSIFTVSLPESLGKSSETQSDVDVPDAENETGSTGNTGDTGNTGSTGNTGNTGNQTDPDTDITDSDAARQARLKGTIFLQIGNYAAVVDGELIHIYPGEKDVVPYLANDRTFVPLRFVVEELSAQVEWIAQTRHVVIKRDGKTLDLAIDAMTYTVDSVSHEMDAPAVIVNDRTMVPIRFVMEALGSAVEWDPDTRMVIVSPSDEPWDVNGALEKEILPDVMTVISALLRDFV